MVETMFWCNLANLSEKYKMTCESPGESERKMQKSKRSKKQICDKIQCLKNAKIPAIRPKLFQKDFKSDLTRTSPKATKVLNLYFYAIFFSILVFKIPLSSAEGFCDPLLCSCNINSANCSHRGFLNLPGGLQQDLKSLGEFQENLIFTYSCLLL